MYNNNNSKPVKRLFEMKDDVLSMFSKIEGDYGDLILQTSIDLIPRLTDPIGTHSLDILQQPQAGRYEDFPFEFRLGEMQYFLQIVLLFNPQNRTDYGLPQTQTDLP